MVCLAIKLTEARIVALSNKGHKLNPLVVTLKPACQVKNMHKRLLLTRRSPLKSQVQNPPERIKQPLHQKSHKRHEQKNSQTLPFFHIYSASSLSHTFNSPNNPPHQEGGVKTLLFLLWWFPSKSFLFVKIRCHIVDFSVPLGWQTLCGIIFLSPKYILQTEFGVLLVVNNCQRREWHFIQWHCQW